MKHLLLATISIFAIFVSCDKKSRDELRGLRIEERILDSANLLSMAQEDSILTIIKDLDNEVGSQIAILTIDTLNGKNLEQYSLNMANHLGIGRKEISDGILVTIALKNSSIRIEVGSGLERIIRDEVAASIIREEMAPRFRRNNFSGGILHAVERMKKLIEDNRELVGQRL